MYKIYFEKWQLRLTLIHFRYRWDSPTIPCSASGVTNAMPCDPRCKRGSGDYPTTIFLLAGLKYHDVRIKRVWKSGPSIAFTPKSPHAICEISAPVITKKKPAYAHSLRSLNPGTKIAITPSIFHVP